MRMDSSGWRRAVAVACTLCFVLAGSVWTRHTEVNDNTHGRKLTEETEKPRVLYIVTTLAEYNSGSRSTVKDSDRLQETLIPIVSEGIRSMVREGYDVDLFLVCHFEVLPERIELVRRALPDSVGLDYWSGATPIGYDTMKDPFTTVYERTQHLSRQHRFVIKDKLLDYDVFVCFEDDMLITGEHVKHFVKMSDEIDRLRELAPEDPVEPTNHHEMTKSFHGPMTKGQLNRMIPGLMRVEVLLDEENYGAQSDTGPVPVDLDFNGQKAEVDPVCCRVSSETASERHPMNPEPSKLMLWETHIKPLGVRKMPEESILDWVVLLRGPNDTDLKTNEVVGNYWSNRNNDYYPNERRPGAMEFKYINNQGGWMATREQIWRWHTEVCPGGFLPPYEAPHYRFDGLDARNVEVCWR